MDDSLNEDLESVRSLLAAATDCLNELDIYPRARVYLDAVALAILSKSIRVGEAICLLTEREFHSEAFGLSRTMLELALSLRHISNADSFERSATFAKYFAKDHEGWTKVISKYYPAAVPNFTPKHTEMLEIAKQFKDPNKWSGKTVRDLAMEDDSSETLQDGSPFRWEFDYEVIYKWTSHYVHGTVVAVDEHAMGPRQPFRVQGGPNVGRGGMALFNLALYLNRSFVAAFRSLNYDMPQDLIDSFETVLKSLVHDSPRMGEGPAGQNG